MGTWDGRRWTDKIHLSGAVENKTFSSRTRAGNDPYTPGSSASVSGGGLESAGAVLRTFGKIELHQIF